MKYPIRCSYWFSCHEGLPKPPPLTKKRIEALFPVENGSKKKPSTTTSREPKSTKEKATAYHKPDRRMQELEKLHKSNGVVSNLQLPEGKRIKLDDRKQSDKSSTARKPKPNFEMEFSQGMDTGDMDWGLPEVAELSDDDLPDAHDILEQHTRKGKMKTNSSSDSPYHDS